MSATINHDAARKILVDAVNEASSDGYAPSSPHAKFIKAVILGTHLTYRYILLNGLLAKATNSACNPLALQAGAETEGAFDARSLCHKVLVPVERELMGKRLGGSNEPFLNKPARFQMLSKDNAVRRGADRRTLNLAILVLSQDYDQDTAAVALKDAIHFVFDRPSRDVTDMLREMSGGGLGISLLEFAQQLVAVSHEGETCALLAGAAFSILYHSEDQEAQVKVHPVNQAGSSSKEVLDVDVYIGNDLKHTVEVKDKSFTPEDVEHAVAKVVEQGHAHFMFLIGPRGQLEGAEYHELQKTWESRGFNIAFLDLLEFFQTIVGISSPITGQELAEILHEHVGSARVKDQTVQHLREVLAAFLEK